MAILALQHDQQGLDRQPDFALEGLRSTSTARIELKQARVRPEDCLLAEPPQAGEVPWLARVRPPFLALQCSLSIGLTRRCLDEARSAMRYGTVLEQQVDDATQALQSHVDELATGVRDQKFVTNPARLFELRIALAEAAQVAAGLELQALGSKAYMDGQSPGFWRRWREVAFLPIITPSLVQLRTELRRQQIQAAVPVAKTGESA